MVTNPAQLTYLQWLSVEETQRQKNIVLARDYYAGDQHVPLTDRQRDYLGFDSEQKFSVNYCKSVVNVVSERLRVSGFSGEEQIAKFAELEWASNKLRSMSKRVHRWALRDGVSFVIVDETEKGLRYTAQQAYTDGTLGGNGYGCKAHYVDGDIYGELESVTKRWDEVYFDTQGNRQIRRRMTIYYADRVEKYAMGGTNEAASALMTPYQDEGDTAWPIPWPYGVPAAIVFSNEDNLSRLTVELMAIQDALNKIWLDILAAADRAGFGIYISHGFWPTTDGTEPLDDNSNVVKIAPGVWIGTKDPSATVTLLDASNLSPLISVKNELLGDLARISGIPISQFQVTGQVAAEGTLKQQESSLIAIVDDRQDVFGDAWESTFGLGATIEKHGYADNLLRTNWRPAETRDEDAMIARAAVMVEKTKVPPPVAWKVVGFTAEEIENMRESEEYQGYLAGIRMMQTLADQGLDEG